jgi:Protein of unknown function (DUF5818)
MEQIGVLKITGRLTTEGVECQAMRGDDGRLYTLIGDNLGRLNLDDRVYVEGTKVEMSHCMQGTTLDVRVIRRIK